MTSIKEKERTLGPGNEVSSSIDQKNCPGMNKALKTVFDLLDVRFETLSMSYVQTYPTDSTAQGSGIENFNDITKDLLQTISSNADGLTKSLGTIDIVKHHLKKSKGRVSPREAMKVNSRLTDTSL